MEFPHNNMPYYVECVIDGVLCHTTTNDKGMANGLRE